MVAKRNLNAQQTPHSTEKGETKMVKARILLGLIAAVPLAAGSLAMADDLNMEKAAQLFETKCAKCHSVDRPKGKTKSKDDWATTVKRMQAKSPGWFTDVEAQTLIEYLSREHGSD
jgi:mono/diheme cytochrome c family protein